MIVKSTLPVEMAFTAFEDDICLAFTRKTLLRGGLIEVACEMIDTQGNASKSSDDPSLLLLRSALLSLSSSFFGSQHREERIATKGYAQYGEVLRQLNGALMVPQRQTTNETILTVVTCMLLELFLPTGPSNFQKHQRGIEALIRLRGPPTETIGDTATIFRGLRVVSIIGALVQGKPSIYAQKEWKLAPVQYTNEIGKLLADLFSILGTYSHVSSVGSTNTNFTDTVQLSARSSCATANLHLPLNPANVNHC